MNKLVVGIAGGIATGKSTFMHGIASRLDAAVTGFGDYVRDEALARRLDAESRVVLQTLGEQLKRELGDEEFARRVLARAPRDRNVIVDGVRHVEIADRIDALVAPRRFALVYLDLDNGTRRQRAQKSRPEDAGRLEQLATHSTEQQVHDGSLQERADHVLDAGLPVEELVNAAVALLLSGR